MIALRCSRLPARPQPQLSDYGSSFRRGGHLVKCYWCKKVWGRKSKQTVLFCKGFKVCKGTSETLKWLLIFCSIGNIADYYTYVSYALTENEKKTHPGMSNIVKLNH